MTAFKDWLNGLTSKTTPVDADEVYVRDSSGTPSSKKLTWANLKATLANTFLSLTGGTVAGGTRTTSGSTLTITETLNNAGVTFPGALVVDVTDTASAAGSLLADFKVGGSTKLSVGKQGNILTSTSGSLYTFLVSATSYVSTEYSYAGTMILRPSNDAYRNHLTHDGSGIIAQRNGTNAQTFRLYNTYTDASNYERGFMRWASNVLEIGAEAAGTGVVRGVTLVTTTGSTIIRLPGQTHGISYNTPVGIPALQVASGTSDGANATYLRGDGLLILASDSGIQRVASKVVGLVSDASGSGAGLQLVEMTAPAAPDTNGVRIYAEDNGSGKTRLMALFATGAAVQIAIEP